ncbi:MAG: hypothetical protein K9M57_01025 [Phycisphaerae bacterium]|nr:hypothetical protein [Phycisphaerae bacterium]
MRRLKRHNKVQQQELLKAVHEAYETIVELHTKKHKGHRRQLPTGQMANLRH